MSVAPLLLLLATAASPQEGASAELKSLLLPGSRVRLVSSAVGARLHGTVIVVDDKELTLMGDGQPAMRVPLGSISEMDVRVSGRRHWRRGLVIGAASGLLMGFSDDAAPVNRNNCGRYSDNFCSRGEAVAGMTGAGALMGAGIGALFKADQWAPVRIGRPTVGSDRRGFAVTVALRF